MNRVTVLATKILTAVLLLLITGFYVLLIGQQLRDGGSELQDVPGALVLACVVGSALCVQVVLVCVWRLVTLAAADLIFNRSAFAWVNVSLAAVLVATALVLVASLVVFSALGDDVPPVLPIAGVVLALFGLGLALVIGVMRALLRQASQLERELAEVV